MDKTANHVTAADSSECFETSAFLSVSRGERTALQQYSHEDHVYIEACCGCSLLSKLTVEKNPLLISSKLLKWFCGFSSLSRTNQVSVKLSNQSSGFQMHKLKSKSPQLKWRGSVHWGHVWCGIYRSDRNINRAHVHWPVSHSRCSTPESCQYKFVLPVWEEQLEAPWRDYSFTYNLQGHMHLSLTNMSLPLPRVGPEGVLFNSCSSFEDANNAAGKQVEIHGNAKCAVSSKNKPTEEQNQEPFSSAGLIL